MSTFCYKCGASVPDGKKFCTSCGTKIDEETAAVVLGTTGVRSSTGTYRANPAPAPISPTYAESSSRYAPVSPTYAEPSLPYAPAKDVPPPKGSIYAPMSTFSYVGWCFLMALPIAGMIVTVLLAFGKGAVNRRNLARAVLVFTVIGIAFMIFSVVTLWPIIKEVTTISVNS